MRAMGIPVGFDSTKVRCPLAVPACSLAAQGKEKPADAKHHAVRLKSKRVYRQYMNRRGQCVFAGDTQLTCLWIAAFAGGFNRPLAPSL